MASEEVAELGCEERSAAQSSLAAELARLPRWQYVLLGAAAARAAQGAEAAALESERCELVLREVAAHAQGEAVRYRAARAVSRGGQLVGGYDLLDTRNMPGWFELHRAGYYSSRLLLPHEQLACDLRYIEVASALAPIEDAVVAADTVRPWLLVHGVHAVEADGPGRAAALALVMEHARAAAHRAAQPALFVAESDEQRDAALTVGWQAASADTAVVPGKSGLHFTLLYVPAKEACMHARGDN